MQDDTGFSFFKEFQSSLVTTIINGLFSLRKSHDKKSLEGSLNMYLKISKINAESLELNAEPHAELENSYSKAA